MGVVSKLDVMKPTIFRWMALVFTFSLTVAISRIPDAPPDVIPPVQVAPDVEMVRYLVISVPSDGEYYIGKQRFTFAELSPVITELLKSIPADKRVLYIKSGSNVRFESLAILSETARHAGINRIEYVWDKKKRGT